MIWRFKKPYYNKLKVTVFIQKFLTCPIGQVSSLFHSPDVRFYLARAIGQPLMSIPEITREPFKILHFLVCLFKCSLCEFIIYFQLPNYRFFATVLLKLRTK